MPTWLVITIGAIGAVGQLFDTIGGVGFGTFSTSAVVSGGVSPAIAVAAVNLAKVGSGTASAISHWKFGNVRWRWVLPLTITGVIGGIAGGMIIVNTPETELRTIITWLLLVLGILIVYRHYPRRRRVPTVSGGSTASIALVRKAPSETRRKFAFLGLGTVAGIVNATSGAYGAFATPALMMARQGSPRYMVGSVNVAEIFVAGASAGTILMQVELTSDLWTVWAALSIGALVTAPLGAFLARRANPRYLAVSIGVGLVAINTWNLIRH